MNGSDEGTIIWTNRAAGTPSLPKHKSGLGAITTYSAEHNGAVFVRANALIDRAGRRFVPAALGLVLIAGWIGTPAHAADLITYGTSTDKQVPLAPPRPGYDWTGFYAGVYGVGQADRGAGADLGLGALAGANLTFDYFLVGGEVSVHGLATGGTATAYGQALGRVGVLATSDALIYATAGAGMDLGLSNAQDILVGGGLEYAVTDNVSLRAQYLHGFSDNATNPDKDQITFGANYHF